jgi:DMSO/TMAO reductase YedYZ molybdopterin-dependent catalytic subunit
MPESVERALMSVSRFNDRAQGLLFDPNRLAPTYPDSMITRPFPFNAYYEEDEVRHVDGEAWRLELSGLIADRKPWTLRQLRAMPQQARSRGTSVLKAGAPSASGAACRSACSCAVSALT